MFKPLGWPLTNSPGMNTSSFFFLLSSWNVGFGFQGYLYRHRSRRNSNKNWCFSFFFSFFFSGSLGGKNNDSNRVARAKNCPGKCDVTWRRAMPLVVRQMQWTIGSDAGTTVTAVPTRLAHIGSCCIEIAVDIAICNCLTSSQVVML
jgi:hypothetical protein